MEKKYQLILVGPSASGKSSIQGWLLENGGFKKPVNFTTRSARNDGELDEYVFLGVDEFVTKLRKGHFLEHTVYNGNFYGVTKFLDHSSHNCIVVDPVGLAQLQRHFTLEGVPFFTAYVSVSRETQEKRLQARRLSYTEVEARKTDMEWFPLAHKDFTLDGEKTVEGEARRAIELVKAAQKELRKNG